MVRGRDVAPRMCPYGACACQDTTRGAVAVDMKLEVIGIPVSDVDVAKGFYVDQVGFGLDHDVRPAPGMRVVQMTPPGSACSVVIGEGMPLGEPGTTKGPRLVAARDQARRRTLDRPPRELITVRGLLNETIQP